MVSETSDLHHVLAEGRGRRQRGRLRPIMALVAVFIIAAVILMATEIGNLFNAMAACLSDAVNCSAATF